MSKRFQPALLGGLVIGVLSGLPVVNIFNLCCCLWVIVGGVLVAYLQQQATPTVRPETSEAVLGGLIAGLVGAVIGTLLDLTFLPFLAPVNQRIMQWAFQNIPNIPPQLQQQMAQNQMGRMAVARVIMKLFFTVPCYAVFAMLGALLGRAMFKPKQPPAGEAGV